MSNRTQKLHLFLDEKVSDPFEIQANADDATFSYASKALKFNGDLQYKNGVLYTSVLSKFGLVDQSQTTEYNRAVSAETLLNGLVVSEGVLARGAELVLRTDLATEVKRATDIDTSFQTALATETSARVSADSKLTSDLSFEVARAGASEGVITGLVSTEQSRAIAAELVHTNAIALEVGVRAAAITAEAKSRSDQDVILLAMIDSEQKARIAYDLSNATNTATNLSAEAKLRSDADIALNARVDFLVVNTDAKKLDSLAEIVGKMNSTGVDVYQRLATIEAVLAELRGSSIYSSAQAGYVAGVPASL